MRNIQAKVLLAALDLRKCRPEIERNMLSKQSSVSSVLMESLSGGPEQLMLTVPLSQGHNSTPVKQVIVKIITSSVTVIFT